MNKVTRNVVAAFFSCYMCTLQVPAMAVETASPATFVGTRPVRQEPAETPAFIGGRLHGFTTQVLYVEGYGKVTATINNDTGEIRSTYPDGSTKTTTAEESVQALQTLLDEASPERRDDLQASMDDRISKEQVCPYVVGLVGEAHTALWLEVLKMAAVNPAIATLTGLGASVFWIWVSTHC